MPALKDETRQESAARIRAHTANAAPYPHRGAAQRKAIIRARIEAATQDFEPVSKEQQRFNLEMHVLEVMSRVDR